jgi:hypothetical protein
MHNTLAIVLVLDETRADVAEYLRRMADKIERGDTFEEAQCNTVRTLVRSAESTGCGELAFAGRYFGVGYDGETINAPKAMFAYEEDAIAYANGGTWANDDDRPSDDGIIFRCDTMIAAWNGLPDEDPVKESESAVARR